ncbi:MAG: NYN domain-containing protein [Protaetiibacter sp.]
MAEPADSDRVAVYIDFDNIVISRYDQLHGDGAWRKDNARDARDAVSGKLEQGRVEVSAILDYASSFGTVAVTRAYADWSVPANSAYKAQLVERAIDLTQLFPVSGTKNGADIRLSVDVLEDLFRLPDITHVVIVAGDSDYIALAQRCKRLGRFVVGIGVAGGTSKALISACDEFEYYDEVVREDEAVQAQAVSDPAVVEALVKPGKTAPAVKPAEQPAAASAPTGQPIGGPGASRLLVKALGLVGKDDDGWSQASAVKSQMKRLNPQYNEKALGFETFTEFVRSRASQVELREEGQLRYLRLRQPKKKQAG